jgi:hypothetical protein
MLQHFNAVMNVMINRKRQAGTIARDVIRTQLVNGLLAGFDLVLDDGTRAGLGLA